MADINKVFSEAQKLKWNIESLLKLSTFETYGGLHIDYEDGEQLFLMEELREIMEQLSDVSRRRKYLSRPIKEVSHLHRSRSGRYEASKGHYYTGRQGIEALIKGGHPEVPYWIWTSVEHDGSDYYLAGHKEINMDGLAVRIREAA